MNNKPVTKAVFPVAGMGTRFLPATKAIPKEMLPIVDKPLIQYAVEEAYAAGIREMIFITGYHKRSIEDHFDSAYQLESELEIANKLELLDTVRSVKPDDMECVYIRQPKALGLGHAICCAERLINDEYFAVLLADDLMVGEGKPILAQMVDVYHQTGGSVMATQDVPREETYKYGILDVAGSAEQTARIVGMIEKPAVEDAPSTLAVSGRYVLSSSVFGYIKSQPKGKGGEIQLTDGIAAMLKDEGVYSYRYNGRRYDCGSKEGYVKATIDMALASNGLSAATREHINSLNI
ncbi:UTP--glucose-1-phosphate uridylyltransferase GalU [Simiduia agarivorans]|uniref:UTP--glucose-1-phosphate uridylyltransferase n=1 Tax=Simiduia agarivorans (strain DSM 21679 / JCM 13881 / BCRC 17597 / SA1) TaxID=1117647 RepID=K4KUY5_SIMAS|nr:UTP--glucose-1-phosphate uridylyltransferase GalU [Simiduia agarivorans]AFU97727.1 UTP-glucose-1-phosphate uridylyltransferase GalU [Simiduia agarivorans SA1 = DSM 21679]